MLFNLADFFSHHFGCKFITALAASINRVQFGLGLPNDAEVFDGHLDRILKQPSSYFFSGGCEDLADSTCWMTWRLVSPPLATIFLKSCAFFPHPQPLLFCPSFGCVGVFNGMVSLVGLNPFGIGGAPCGSGGGGNPRLVILRLSLFIARVRLFWARLWNSISFCGFIWFPPGLLFPVDSPTTL